MTLSTIIADGTEFSLARTSAGQLRVAAEGIDVGPVRGSKRLTGPQLGATVAASRAIYRALHAAAGGRAL